MGKVVGRFGLALVAFALGCSGSSNPPIDDGGPPLSDAPIVELWAECDERCVPCPMQAGQTECRPTAGATEITCDGCNFYCSSPMVFRAEYAGTSTAGEPMACVDTGPEEIFVCTDPRDGSAVEIGRPCWRQINR